MGMRRTVLMLASVATTMLLTSGVALAALNTIQCKTYKYCHGTAERDRMKGTDGYNWMYGRENADILKGFRGEDHLYGEGGNDRLYSGPGYYSLWGGDGNDLLDAYEGSGGDLIGDSGNDRLLAGPGMNGLEGGPGDDTLEGDRGGDFYHFTDDWGNDTIVDAVVPVDSIFKDNSVNFDRWYSGGALVINLSSDSGPLPEVTNGTDAINWSGDVIDNVYNASYETDDQISGTEAPNRIFSRGALFRFPDSPTTADGDTVLAAGGDDEIRVDDDDGDDTVDCGAGADTVFFDEGDELVVPDACETKNPQEG
jgi:Ca2+-binding RTX toxin-like protein